MQTITFWIGFCCLTVACGGDDGNVVIDVAPGADTPAGADAATFDGAGDDAAGAADASPVPDGAGVPGVTCGADTCDDTEKCCITVAGMMTTETCVPRTDPCVGVALDCDGPEDCAAGEVCCGSLVGGGSASCEASGSCAGLLLCQSATDCPTSDPFCCESPVLSASVCSMMACP